jgi:hypothetical protein
MPNVDYDEGRRCARVVDALAVKVDALVTGEDCELCHVLDTFAHKLRVLAADLLEVTETVEKHGGRHSV